MDLHRSGLNLTEQQHLRRNGNSKWIVRPLVPRGEGCGQSGAEQDESSDNMVLATFHECNLQFLSFIGTDAGKGDPVTGEQLAVQPSGFFAETCVDTRGRV